MAAQRPWGLSAYLLPLQVKHGQIFLEVGAGHLSKHKCMLGVCLHWFPVYLSGALPFWSHWRNSLLMLPIAPALLHCVVRISALSHRREQSQGPQTHLAEAVLDLGTVTGIPQSSNYCHLVWVSDLEQGAGQHAGLPLPADQPRAELWPFIIVTMMVITVIYWTLTVGQALLGVLHGNRASSPLLLLPGFSRPLLLMF